MSILGRLFEPQVRSRLLWDEMVIDEVQKHWVASFPYYCLMVLSIPIFLLIIVVPEVFWVPMLLGLTSLLWELAGFHQNYMDRFVVTNMRSSGCTGSSLSRWPPCR
ncbi:MAG: hypothetical protein R2722_04450 [Tessaracoccus sp.]